MLLREPYPLDARNPILEVLRVICYPMQRAILWPDMACENAPLPEGCICRLRVYGPAGPETAAAYLATGYAETLREALVDAICEAVCRGSAEEACTLLRHLRGEYYRTRRAVKTYKWTEVQNYAHR